MNLELLDPFGRQIPDRIDATLACPRDDSLAAYHVAWNRRGTYLAAGYANGMTAVHSLHSRTVAALYPQTHGSTLLTTGITALSWARRSRTLLTGGTDSASVYLWDMSHPYGPERACLLVQQDPEANSDEIERVFSRRLDSLDSLHKNAQTQAMGFANEEDPTTECATEARHVNVRYSASDNPVQPSDVFQGTRYPALTWSFGRAVGASLEIHPTLAHAGLATLQEGDLVLFYCHPSIWYKNKDSEVATPVHMVPLSTPDQYTIACATLSPSGREIFAATKDGRLVGWTNLDDSFWENLLDVDLEVHAPAFIVDLPTKPSAWHIMVSRNDKYLVLNCADGVLRVYETAECLAGDTKQGGMVAKTIHSVGQYQDVVNKVKFSSCDFSGDGEYLVGAVNRPDNRYELSVWSTATGQLVDTLTGPSVQLCSVSWHPSRALVAVATADGLVDLWGPRINWTAFAPDFQALPRNIEYVEREDEFDQDAKGNYLTATAEDGAAGQGSLANTVIDVLTIEAVAAYASDSEDETDVFAFVPRVHKSTKQSSRTKDD
jgi:WD40 repeat protein